MGEKVERDSPLNAIALTNASERSTSFCIEDETPSSNPAKVRVRMLIMTTRLTPKLSLSAESVPSPEAPGVLVVDDDALMRNLMTTVLQRRGFYVLTAASGAEALATYRQHGLRIAVVLLDVRMPVQDGPTTLAQLRQLKPDLCCCFMTGHAGEYTLDDLLACGASHCFDKPFSVDEVAQTLLQLAKAS
jgi:CheY-like chemotaxis protein